MPKALKMFIVTGHKNNEAYIHYKYLDKARALESATQLARQYEGKEFTISEEIEVVKSPKKPVQRYQVGQQFRVGTDILSFKKHSIITIQSDENWHTHNNYACSGINHSNVPMYDNLSDIQLTDKCSILPY